MTSLPLVLVLRMDGAGDNSEAATPWGRDHVLWLLSADRAEGTPENPGESRNQERLGGEHLPDGHLWVTQGGTGPRGVGGTLYWKWGAGRMTGQMTGSRAGPGEGEGEGGREEGEGGSTPGRVTVIGCDPSGSWWTIKDEGRGHSHSC